MGLLVCERRSELGTLGEFRKSPLMEMGRPALGSTCGELAAESCEALLWRHTSLERLPLFCFRCLPPVRVGGRGGCGQAAEGVGVRVAGGAQRGRWGGGHRRWRAPCKRSARAAPTHGTEATRANRNTQTAAAALAGEPCGHAAAAAGFPGEMPPGGR